MEPIIQYLSDSDHENNEQRKIIFNDNDVAKINNIRNNYSNDKKAYPDPPNEISENQLWIIKSQYTDSLGNNLSAPYPFYVVTHGPKFYFNTKSFINIYVVSPFIEMAADDDIIIYDDSFLGFPFFIELWNSQPISTEILDVYAGKLSFNEYNLKDEQKSSNSNSFGTLKYLKDSVDSLVKFSESMNLISSNNQNTSFDLSNYSMQLLELLNRKKKVNKILASVEESLQNYASDTSDLLASKSQSSLKVEVKNSLHKIQDILVDNESYDDLAEALIYDLRFHFNYFNDKNSNNISQKMYDLDINGINEKFKDTTNNISNYITAISRFISSESDVIELFKVYDRNKNVREVGPSKNSSNKKREFYLPDYIINDFRILEVQNASFLSNSALSYLTAFDSE